MPPATTSPLAQHRLALYGSASLVATSAVVMRAFKERANFYAATVWLGRSNGCILVLVNFGIFCTILFGKFCQAVFFGQLRPIEVEHLYERSWYAVTETLLAMTIFRDQFDASFIILFGTLLFLKVFHWLCADRVELMEQSPSLSRLFHARMVSVLWTLFCLDLFLVAFAIEVLILEQQRMGIMIMFASEFTILTATLWSTIAKYVLNCVDLRSDEPWEGKSMYVSAVDLVTDFLKLATYLCFFSLILTYYGLPLNIVRDVYVTGRSFFGRIRDLLRYRAATRNMDTRFPNATAEDLARTDATCIICRDEMVARGEGEFTPPGAVNDTPKKLACGHVFHFNCLRSWLERQQSCPTCRRTVFDTPEQQPAAQQQVQQQQLQQQQGAQGGGGAAAAAAIAPYLGFGQGGAAPGQAAPTPTAAPQTPAPAQLERSHSGGGGGAEQVYPQHSAQRQRLQALLNQVVEGAPMARQGPPTPATGAAWVPPPPDALRPSGWAAAPTPAPTTAPTSAGPSSPLPTSTTPGSDPTDPRAAARAAVLRRFEALGSGSGGEVGKRVATSPFPTAATASLDKKGKGKAREVEDIIREEDEPVAPLSTGLSSSTTPATTSGASSTAAQRSAVEEHMKDLDALGRKVWELQCELGRVLSTMPAAGSTGDDDNAQDTDKGVSRSTQEERGSEAAHQEGPVPSAEQGAHLDSESYS